MSDKVAAPRTDDGKLIAIPIQYLPEHLNQCLVEVITYLLLREEHDEIVLRTSDTNSLLNDLLKENRIPVIIAEGDSENQILRFKILCTKDENDIQLAIPPEVAGKIGLTEEDRL